ncbi:MAG TPA: nucleoside-triphosphatase [Chitinophagaceae bacterium]|nr:nucleoside-triphosphatase [Chitinophagaceae bacterium]
MNRGLYKEEPQLVYYRLIALWVLCEAMIGGIIHGLRIPVSGLIVGSCAVICISLIAFYNHVKGAILKATLIVAIFKMMLSPQAPPPAYIAVFFQGFMGEILFWKRRLYPVACILLGILALLESGLQRILVLTIVYGNDLWRSVNDFISKLVKQKQGTNYSLIIGGVYVLLHLVAGVIAGWWASVLPKEIEQWSGEEGNRVLEVAASIDTPARGKRKRSIKTGLLITWIILVLLYAQSYFNLGTPLLPASTSLKILLRSLIIVFTWYFIVGPLLRQLLHAWLQKKQIHSQAEIQSVLMLLPSTEALIRSSWKQSRVKRGIKRLGEWGKLVIVNALGAEQVSPGDSIYILTGPIQTGKTSSLQQWAENREDVYGILTPVINGKRVFLNVRTGEQWPMEASGTDKEFIIVGKYNFSKIGFDKAAEIIRASIQAPGWLVIDEIGPLELKGEGFNAILKKVISNRKGKTLLVVRDKAEMPVKVKRAFGIEKSMQVNSVKLLAE